MTTIQQLFDRDISRQIQEVIKVDQQDDAVVITEIEEYVATDAIKRSFASVLEAYAEVPNKPSDRMAVWVSGFFGSGKSSFAKLLGAAIGNRELQGKSAAKRVADQFGDGRVSVVLERISQKMPTEVVVFDLATDSRVRNASQKLTEIIYRQLLEHLGYSRDLDLAELEINLEDDGRLQAFQEAFQRQTGKAWDDRKSLTAFAMSEASRVMQELEPKTYPSADSWSKAARDRFDISPNDLADRCIRLTKRRRGDKQLVFVIDEVGQFVARDVNKMLDLQGIVQALGRVGQGKVWIVVTSQEKLNEMVGSLDDKRVEQARLMDRFPDHLRVHLEPSDITTVTSKRVLSKNAEGEKALRKLFEDHRGRLSHCSQPQADVKLDELTADSFIRLYPLVPYQIKLLIDIVSGLRTQGGAIAHVGGANRTVIKLSQQLLTNPQVGLADKPVGRLVSLDHVFDLVRGNIPSEIREKIDRISTEVKHKLAQPVAKAIYLLQLVPTIKRTAETLAAVLHPAVDADSLQSEVNEALQALEKAHQVRKGDDGYRIPTPSEDDWEKHRAGLAPKNADLAKIIGDQVELLWQPVPTHEFEETRVFKAGLKLNGRDRVEGDLTFEVYTHARDQYYDERLAEARRSSQADRKSVFWVVPLSDRIEKTAEEMFRSQEMVTRKGRSLATPTEEKLLGEEKRRSQANQDELKRLVREAFTTGAIYFRGNDRSADQNETDVGKIASSRMKDALPEVFERFKDAAARVQKRDAEALLTNTNLQGLPPIFSQLKLVRTQNNRGIINVEQPPLQDVMAKIESVTSYGHQATGKMLESDFAKDPFGWDFEIVKLLTLCLLRAGKIVAVSQGRTIESVPSDEARDLFTANPKFRAASFRPKKAIDAEQLTTAADNFKATFGKDVPELTASAIATAIREVSSQKEDDLSDVRTTLVADALPGGEVLAGALSQIKSLRTGTEEDVVQAFNTSHNTIKEAIARAATLKGKLTEPNLVAIRNARSAMASMWPFLDSEPDTEQPLRDAAARLADLLKRETFFEEIPAISQAAAAIRESYSRRFSKAVTDRVTAYSAALAELKAVPGWTNLTPEQQSRIGSVLETLAKPESSESTPIVQIRSDTDACASRLAAAVREVNTIIEGERLVTVKSTKYFSKAIENPEQLNAALDALRQDCENELGRGKKILIQ
ncbi:MAG: BREX system P-loop protein BrxC [Phycisphaerales bacterium]|nr:BREX system P-loop protein BrxC [Phycisphaerales bacterium]